MHVTVQSFFIPHVTFWILTQGRHYLLTLIILLTLIFLCGFGVMPSSSAIATIISSCGDREREKKRDPSRD